MSSDLSDERVEDRSRDDGQMPAKSILAGEIESGMNELERQASGSFLSGLSAGLDIGFGPLFMAILLTLVGGTWGEPATHLAIANAYAIGFIFVIGGRSALFTEHTTLAFLPVLDGRATLRQLGRLWTLVYAGNVLGGSIFAVSMVVLAPAYGMTDAATFAHIASPLVSHSPPILLAGAVLAGWMMGLLSWLLTSAKDSISRIFLVWLVTFGIGVAHLPHSIAGNVEVLAGTLVSSDITFLNYAGFLLLSTVGNAVGGTVFVALVKYGHTVRGGE